MRRDTRVSVCPPFDRRRDGAAGAVLFLLLLAVYWTGRSSTFGAGDSPQHVLSALTWGVSRPPGYPLYTALAHFFSRLPLGPAAASVNGFSGLLHAAAAALFFLLLRRGGCAAPAALAAMGLLAFSPLYWYYSVTAEVRALNDLLALGAAYAAQIWRQERRPGAWLALAACLGFGLSHHPTYILLAPAILLYAAAPGPGRRRWLLLAGVAACCAALPYLVLGLRLSLGPAPLYNADEVRTWRDILGLALRRNTGGILSMASGATPLGAARFELGLLWRGLGWFGGLVNSDLTAPGALLASLGGLRLWRRQRPLFVFWLLWLAGAGALFIAVSSQQMRFGDADYLRAMFLRFYLLPMIALFALAGFGAQSLLERVRPSLGWAFAAAAALGPLLLRPVGLRGCDPLMDYARAVLRSTGPRDMVILGSDDTIFSMTYLDVVEGRVEDRVFLLPGLFSYAPYRAGIEKRHPGLVLPLEKGGLSRRMSDWARLNPDRALFGEPTLRDEILASAETTSPRGVLIRVGGGRPSGELASREAARFAGNFPPRCGLRDFTQEVYLKKAYGMMAEYYLSRLVEPAEAPLRRRLEEALASLQ